MTNKSKNPAVSPKIYIDRYRRTVAKETGKKPDESGDDLRKMHRERYRVFIEDVADGFYETNLDGNFKFFNNAFCQIYGYSRQEMENRNFREFMSAENAENAYAHFHEIFLTGEEMPAIQWEIIRKDGEIRIVEISARLISDDQGRRIGFRGIARDVTEKHRTQEALKASEQCAHELYEVSRLAERRNRALLDFLPDPVFVFNLDGTVSYLNPAFEKTFGWKFSEMKGKIVPFVPDHLKEDTKKEIRRLYEEGVLHGIETKRLTKEGRLRDVVIDAAIFYDGEEEQKPAGQVAVFRDITYEKRVARTNQSMFRIAKALPSLHGLDELLEFIIREVQVILDVDGASVILLDEDKNEFYFKAANYGDIDTDRRLKITRFPADKGVAGYVYQTGRPIIVNDTSQSEFFFHHVDEQSGYETKSMLDVPIRTQEQMIGVLCTVNKKGSEFDQGDVDLLNTIASMVALPIENARINDELKRSYEEVKSINRAKERVIHHLSHELKTPVAVLAASLNILDKKIQGRNLKDADKIMDRAQRNLDRILQMQYGIEDILRENDYQAHRMMSLLLDVCSDELESLVDEETGNEEIVPRIRRRIEEIFGRRDSVAEIIRLDQFTEDALVSLKSKFAHRHCEISILLLPATPIFFPPDVLFKIVEGLVRNAIENTPDGGKIEIIVRDAKENPEFRIRDFGVGITEDNQRLVFESNFTTKETMQYSSRKPYDFNAGGKGFDLLRMKIFSERYHFKISLASERCRYIPKDEDICPGDIASCPNCRQKEDCLHSGGTAVTLKFTPYKQNEKEE